ncbi:MAG: hypothetical protein QHC79_04115 [Pseudosphingobacterium sp.]|nr:hypothetical protein [Olivibacter sp. UJ_SKK_5.1]MDX3912699.1 hypothetical protein [Pseudosphingobacterium sp.]
MTRLFCIGILFILFYSCREEMNPVPGTEGGKSRIVQVLAGEGNSFFLRDNGDLYAVGLNSDGQLGNNSIEDIIVPAKVMGDVKAIAAGTMHTVILKKDGTVWATGNNRSGQLGDSTNTSSLTPIKVMEDVKAISAGGISSFFVTMDGKMWGTGGNDYGQLGISDDIFNRKIPSLISEDVEAVSNSRFHTIFLKSNGEVYKMGLDTTLEGVNENEYTYKILSHPYVIENNVRDLHTNVLATMMIKNDNTIWVRGARGSGRLGLGLNPDAGDARVSTYVISDVIEASLGLFHSLIIKSDSTIWMSGINNYGQLGSDMPERSDVFISSEKIGKVSMISAGLGHSIFVKDEKIWGLGDNSNHQISPSDTQSFSEPVLIELNE